MVAFPILKWVILAKLFNFFFFPLEVVGHIRSMGLFVAVYQGKKSGDKHIIFQIYRFPLSFL